MLDRFALRTLPFLSFAVVLLNLAVAAESRAFAQGVPSTEPITLLASPAAKPLAALPMSTATSLPEQQIIHFDGPNGTGQVAAQTVRMRLNAPLTIHGITIDPALNNKQEFRVTDVSGCDVSGNYKNSEGTVCSVEIEFTPAYPGVRRSFLQVRASDQTIPIAMAATSSMPLAVLSPGIISTFVGKGTISETGDGGPASDASISSPFSLANDAAGNLYFGGLNSIRKIDIRTNIISKIAGNGVYANAGDGGLAINASVASVSGLAFDASGDLYLSSRADTTSEIRKINLSTGIITKVAGNGANTFSGDGGSALNAGLVFGRHIVFDSIGDIYFADQTGNRIRKIDRSTGIISTVAGDGVAKSTGDGGLATAAQLNGPSGLAIDADNNIYASEAFGYNIRKIDGRSGIISTIAGTGVSGYTGDGGLATSARIGRVFGMTLDIAGNLYLADYIRYVVRKVDVKTGVISTIAGTGVSLYSGDEGASTLASLRGPFDVMFDSAANLYIADYSNGRIRRIAADRSVLSFPTPTMAGLVDTTDGPGSVTVTNMGNAPLTFSVPATGTNPAISNQDFTMNAASTCAQLSPSSAPTTLATGTSCKLAVDFTPTQAGNLSATLVLSNDSGNVAGAQQAVQLVGAGFSSTADTTTTKISSFPNATYVAGQTVALAATVVDSKDPSQIPSGTVTFSIALGTAAPTTGTAPLVNGIATINFVPASGTYKITAAFKTANANLFQNSADTVGRTFQVLSDFTITTNPQSSVTSITASVSGATPFFIVRPSPGGGGLFPGAVTLSISGLPPGATADLSPSSLAQDAGAQDVKVTVNLSQMAARNEPSTGGGKTQLALAGMFLTIGLLGRRRRAMNLLALAMIAVTTSLMSGCMQSTNTPLTPYTIVVTATSGPVQHSTSIQLSVSR